MWTNIRGNNVSGMGHNAVRNEPREGNYNQANRTNVFTSVGSRSRPEHVLPGTRHNSVRNERRGGIFGGINRTNLLQTRVDSRSRTEHVLPGFRNNYGDTNYRESIRIRKFDTNVRFGMREAGYIPLIGTIIGICNFVYGIMCILNLTSLTPSIGYRYCGRGLVEMVPIVGGISLYYYDRR